MDRALDKLFFSFSSILLDLCSIKYPKTKTKQDNLSFATEVYTAVCIVYSIYNLLYIIFDTYFVIVVHRDNLSFATGSTLRSREI